VTSTRIAPVDFDAALAAAHEIALGSFELGPKQPIVHELEAATDRGAAVTVTLASSAFWLSEAARGSIVAGNQAVANDLRARGADVRFAGPNEMFHIKAAVVDGVVYLDDRNWAAAGPQTMLRIDNAGATEAVRRALREAPPDGLGPPDLALTKSAALSLEAAVLARPETREVDVETETFTAGPIAEALMASARAGLPTRLLVANDRQEISGEHESAALVAARAAGVEIRTVGVSEKLAIAGDVAWTGSANASWSDEHSIDWGFVARERPLVDELAAAFATNWRASKPWAPPPDPLGAASVPGAAPAAPPGPMTAPATVSDPASDQAGASKASALRVVAATTSASEIASRSASLATVAVMNAGSLRFPRCGTGARYGESVSSTRWPSPTDATASRMTPADLNVTTPPIPRTNPNSSTYVLAAAASPEKQWMTARFGGPSARSSATKSSKASR